MKKTQKGFTLVELLVVIAILAILTTVAVVGYTAYVNKAKETKVKTEVQQIATYISAEFADDNKWGDLDKNNTDTKAWETAIKSCDELNGFTGTISVSIENGAITITYTIDGKSATSTIK